VGCPAVKSIALVEDSVTFNKIPVVLILYDDLVTLTSHFEARRLD